MQEIVAWPIQARLTWVANWRRLIAANADSLVALVQLEVRKPEAEALTGDVMSLLAACRWHERRAARILAPRRLGGRPLWLMGQRHTLARAPVGTVGIIATWNYPVQLLGIQLLQALVAGNRVIVKPSENAPRTQAYLLKLAIEAGLPAGQLRWTPATREAGPRLLASEKLDHVIFTGSTRVGRQVAAWAAETLTPTTLELSGSDSAIVWADADTKLAARVIWHALTMNAGQTCMAPRRVFVSAKAYPGYVSALSFLAAGAKPQSLIDAAAARQCRVAAQEAMRAGGRLTLGVDELESSPVRQRDTQAITAPEETFRPLAIVDMPEEYLSRERALFGPVLLVYAAADDAHALAMHARCPHRLNTAIFTRDVSRARRVATTLGSGFVTINDAHIPTAHPGASITGTGASGWGASRGELGLLALTRPVFVSTTSTYVRTPTSEPDARGVSMLWKAVGWLYGGRGGPARRVAPDGLEGCESAGVGGVPKRALDGAPGDSHINDHANPGDTPARQAVQGPA